MGGFNFEKVSREFAVNNAADADNIYGDKFTKGEKCVTEIGNNVMLDFGEFDFSEKQPSRLVISGKSPLALNSIHLILNGSEGENRILCEFRTDDSENYAQKSFDISGISGKQKVSFAFLPEAISILNISDLSNKNAPYRFCTERLLVLKVYYFVGYHRVGNKLGGIKVFFVHINSGYLMSVVGGIIVNALFQYCSSLYKWLSHTCSLPPRSSPFVGQLSLKCGRTGLHCFARQGRSVSSFSQMLLL